jgi:FkbM family methyltransferase
MSLDLSDSIQAQIFLTGVWERYVTQVIADALRPGDIFVDIGANVGYYSLLASHLVGPNGRAYAIEASPTIYRKLTNNIAANAAANVIAINGAVSDKPGERELWLKRDNLCLSTIIKKSTVTEKLAEKLGDVYDHGPEALIPTNVIQAWVPIDDLLRARFIKIDIEGAESLAVRGVAPILSEFSPETEWLVELSPENCPHGIEDTDWAFGEFLRAGYLAYKLDNAYSSDFYYLSSDSPHIRQIFDPPQERLSDILFTRTPRTLPSSSCFDQ